MSADGQHLEPFVDALKRMGGMYGSAWVNGVLQTDVVECIATTEQQRTTLQLVGNQSEGYKGTRLTRSATIRTQKIDSRWSMLVYNQTSQSLDDRRWWRDNPGGDPSASPSGGPAPQRSFVLKLAIDDPDAYGYEAWQLEGCQIWSWRMGSGQSEDTIQPDYPMTWANERPISAFSVTPGQTTGTDSTPAPVVVYNTGAAPYAS